MASMMAANRVKRSAADADRELNRTMGWSFALRSGWNRASAFHEGTQRAEVPHLWHGGRAFPDHGPHIGRGHRTSTMWRGT
jgi:hypothetical protein